MKYVHSYIMCFVCSLIFFANNLTAQSVAINGGVFLMGSESGDVDEKPVHSVTLSPFKIDAHEVTEAQYDSCVLSGKCSQAHYSDGKCGVWTSNGFQNVNVPADRRHSARPVVCVTWFQAQAFCLAHGKQLPREAQWEYAASAGKHSKYSWGDQPPTQSYCAVTSNQKPDKVCSHASNASGLSDMTGNVWEWTGDYYGQDYYSFSSLQNPTGPDVGLYRVVRGGGWYSNAEQLRVTNRNWFSPDFAEVSVGFRCVSSSQ
jgi:formylglycine-generating enzyme required for sulfatase activity